MKGKTPMLAESVSSFAPSGFERISIDQLERLNQTEIDRLPFGVIGLAPTGKVELYNATESRMAGLHPAEVLGSPFFTEVGRCMNNKRVAGRFEETTELDETIDFVLTLRMKITPATLRMLRKPSSRLRYLLIHR